MFETTTDYIKTTLNSIMLVITSTRDVIITIGDAISTLIQILGFIGFRVFILLCLTTFSVWILNICSPTTKRINYFLSVVLVSCISVRSKMPLQIVTFKYLAIILSPLVITTLIHYLYKISKILKKIIDKKSNEFIAKANFNVIPVNLRIPEILKPVILFTELPTKEEFEKIDEKIFEKEKIALADNDGKIIFSIENKVSQFKKSCEDKDTNIIFFYNSNYKSNQIVNEIIKIQKIKQIKNIVGDKDNCFVLNFLQDKWGWQVVYGDKNLIKKEFELKIINNYDFKTKTIKRKIIASDIGVFAIEPITIKNKILFLGGEVENEKILYRYLYQIQNYIIKNRQIPSAIILCNINVKDIATIIEDFNYNLKQKGLVVIPIFLTNDTGIIISNKNCLIEYRKEKFSLNQIL